MSKQRAGSDDKLKISLKELGNQWKEMGLAGQASYKAQSRKEFEERQEAAKTRQVKARFNAGATASSQKRPSDTDIHCQDPKETDGEVAILAKRYRLDCALPKLGQGSYGQVTIVKDVTNGRKLAAKIGEQLSLEREVCILKSLDHPAFLKILEHASCGGLSFFIMPDAGENVSQHCGKFKGEAMDALTIQLMDALHALHRKDILHADVKPANVLFCWRTDRLLHSLFLGFVLPTHVYSLTSFDEVVPSGLSSLASLRLFVYT